MLSDQSSAQYTYAAQDGSKSYVKDKANIMISPSNFGLTTTAPKPTGTYEVMIIPEIITWQGRNKSKQITIARKSI